MDLFREELEARFGGWMVEDVEAIEDWLGREIEVIPRPYMEKDRATSERDEIELGLRATPTRREFRPVFRKRLVHEAIHLGGLVHGRESRETGYYSNISRDELSERVMEEELGWEPPDEELYGNYLSRRKELKREEREKRKRKSKYIVYCPNCGKEWYRKKKSSLLKHPSDYFCDECGTELKSRTKDGHEVESRGRERVYEYGCPRCGWWRTVHRRTKTTKNIDDYRCRNCGGDLSMREVSKGDEGESRAKKLSDFT